MKASQVIDPAISAPQLDPPGAGIPAYQRALLRLLVKPLVANRADWDLSTEKFLSVTRKIRRELEGLSPAQLEKKVLIEPMTGIEDSSRYWSIAMTLDHILIVGKQVAHLVRELDAGRVPPGVASTAAVKPTGARTTEEILRSFNKFCDVEIPALLSSLKNRNSPLLFLHPWFGPMKAKAWYWLLGTHHGLHLKQIREIKKGLVI